MSTKSKPKLQGESLGEKLARLVETTPTHHCSLGVIFESLDKEGRASLDAVLKSNAPTLTIYGVLKSDGQGIGRQFLAQKRKCYLTSESCVCRELVK